MSIVSFRGSIGSREWEFYSSPRMGVVRLLAATCCVGARWPEHSKALYFSASQRRLLRTSCLTRTYGAKQLLVPPNRGSHARARCNLRWQRLRSTCHRGLAAQFERHLPRKREESGVAIFIADASLAGRHRGVHDAPVGSSTLADVQSNFFNFWPRAVFSIEARGRRTQ